MVKAITINELTDAEIRYAIDAINAKRKKEDLERRVNMAKDCYNNFLSLCKDLNVQVLVEGGYISKYSNLEKVKLKFI